MNPYRAYVNADNNIDDDNKPRLLLKVYQALLDKIDIAKAATRNRDFQKKYEELTKATAILELLDSSLDLSQGEIPKNLSDLYRYLVQRLLTVHTNNDPAVLDECRIIIAEINEGFVGAYNKEIAARQKTQKSQNAFALSRPASLI